MCLVFLELLWLVAGRREKMGARKCRFGHGSVRSHSIRFAGESFASVQEPKGPPIFCHDFSSSVTWLLDAPSKEKIWMGWHFITWYNFSPRSAWLICHAAGTSLIFEAKQGWTWLVLGWMTTQGELDISATTFVANIPLGYQPAFFLWFNLPPKLQNLDLLIMSWHPNSHDVVSNSSRKFLLYYRVFQNGRDWLPSRLDKHCLGCFLKSPYLADALSEM